MFRKSKNKRPEPPVLESHEMRNKEAFPFPERQCWLYISSKYKEVLFVPMGKIDKWKSRELNSVVSKQWPVNIGDLQDLIQETLDKWTDPVEDTEPSNDNWYSYNASKAKTRKSFEVEYVQMRLTTDMEREYGHGEVERIIIKASPKNWLDDNYKLVGKNHLMETQVAQVVIDVFSACEKIRTI